VRSAATAMTGAVAVASTACGPVRVDEHRHVEELKDALDLASRRRGGECWKCGRWVCPPLTCMACLADAPEELRAINADLTAEVEQLTADRAALLAACRKAIGFIGSTCVSRQEMLDVLGQLNGVITEVEREGRP
jgi:hypothetical protein